MTRIFKDIPAKRERVPMLVGLVGPSGSGKTYSALRLATGMQRATGGEIFYIDTESRRALHYADDFKFRHIAMEAPFSPLDYLAAIEHCVKQNAGVLIVDSMSHEHEGPGGVLEMHDTELDRMAGDDYRKRQKMTFTAWKEPKQQRRRLINSILQLGVNAIFCFRAKEKLRIIPGKNPVNRGWQAIAGEEFVYEMTANVLLYPGAEGVPNWNPDEKDERAITKRPAKLASKFSDGQPLSEDSGEALSRWAEGDTDNQVSDQDFAQSLIELTDVATRDQLTTLRESWVDRNWSPEQKVELNNVLRVKLSSLSE